ncbi:MAG: DUF1697 domain-containing protein [Gammaproteobacteria bacterium]|nr:DUF1697 domain-containing protein [Gammaproteobacteria bacterium]
MSVKVVLLRGINVGGRNSLPMKGLRELFDELGCRDVHTYIQSGNVVFKSDEDDDVLSLRLADGIKQGFGFEPFVQVLEGDVFRAIADDNPYKNDPIDSKFLHVLFLAERPAKPDIQKMQERASRTERFLLTDDALYLSAPDGIGRSKFAAGVERWLGVQATGRNWRTVCKLVDMIDAAR